MKFETKAVHIGRHTDESTGAITNPIHLSTTFEREADGTFPSGFIYSRMGNPNRNSLEECLAALEGGESALSFSSGAAATSAIIQALKPNNHVIFPDDVYYGSIKIVKDIFSSWGIKYSIVDMTDVSAVEKAITHETKLIWIETPSNPLLKIVDIETIVNCAKKHNIISVVDNTWPTPVLQNPILLGADLVLHSTTKYIGGNSDILSGAVVAAKNNEFFLRIAMIQKTMGAVPSPFECWLMLRSLPTLSIRVREQSLNAEKIASFLNNHPNVEIVNYPGLTTHHGHEMAKKQMKGFGGMLSFHVKSTEKDAMKVAGQVKIFTRATSLGGPHSLIEHRASIEGPDSKTPVNLLRVSVGLEHVDDLIQDLDQALSSLKK